MIPVRIFVGYDTRLTLNYHVFVQSVLKHASIPVSITPLKLDQLKNIWTREKTPDQLTDFSYSRFLVPYLCQFQGWALFMDGTDMMLRDDIAKLWALRQDDYDVMVVKHPELSEKHTFMNKAIETYPMFNWSSLMLFNNAKCAKLTNDYVSTAGYHDLHQFKWLERLDRIGDLPMSWNHLVGYHEDDSDVALVHWTQKAPDSKEVPRSMFEKEWYQLYRKLDPA